MRHALFAWIMVAGSSDQATAVPKFQPINEGTCSAEHSGITTLGLFFEPNLESPRQKRYQSH